MFKHCDMRYRNQQEKERLSRTSYCEFSNEEVIGVLALNDLFETYYRDSIMGLIKEIRRRIEDDSLHLNGETKKKVSAVLVALLTQAVPNTDLYSSETKEIVATLQTIGYSMEKILAFVHYETLERCSKDFLPPGTPRYTKKELLKKYPFCRENGITWNYAKMIRRNDPDQLY